MRSTRFVVQFGFFISLVGLLLACTTSRPSTPPLGWLESGSIALARPIPAPIHAQPTTALGFWSWYPTQLLTGQATLALDRNARTLTFTTPSGETVSIPNVDVAATLQPGTYEVLHKQQNPLWYAPDQYFSSRKLPVPSQGDRSRYRRGALGEYAIFINQETPIHCGSIWSDEVGGIRAGCEELSRIYFSVEIGTTIEIK